jgi:hypothetical protein
MNSTILDSLDYFHSIKNISENEIKLTNELYNLLPIAYVKEGDKFVKKVYNLIGIYLEEQEEFLWAWNTNFYKYLHTKTNQLILHGINIEPINMDDFYLKKILTTGKIKTNNDYIITIIMALSCYLTKAHAYIFEGTKKENYASFFVFYDIKDVEGLEIKSEL